MGETPGTFDARAAWDRLQELFRKLTGTVDAEIYDACRAEFDFLVAQLRARQEPVPPAVLANPLLRKHFVPDVPETPTEPEAVELFGVPVVDRPVDPEPVIEEDPGDLPEPTAEQLAAADDFIRRAKVAQMRGNRDEALNLLKQAEQAAPGASVVLEALGDEMAAARKTKEARLYYERAKRADPGNVSADKKHAELIFRTDAAQHIYRNLDDAESVASARSAAILSFMVPGLGQIVSGEIVKGVVFLVGVFGLWTVAFLMGLKDALAKLMNISSAGSEPNPMVYVVALAAIVLFFINLGDATSRAKRGSARRIDRPLPPENLPFE